MPTLVPHHLTFRSGLHLGTRGVNLEEAGLAIPSDTLFSAILDTGRRKGLDIGAFVAPFAAAPPDAPFLITSAFPRVGQVRFYPAPVALDVLLKPESIHQAGKAARRVRYISEGLLHKVLSGGKLDADLFPLNSQDQPVRGAALQGGALWFGLDELDQMPPALRLPVGRRHAFPQFKVWEQDRLPRVTISRVTQSSTVYSAGRTVFAEDCGLWFGIGWRKPDDLFAAGQTYRQALTSILQTLQDDGLGGERTSGYGSFKMMVNDEINLGKVPGPGRPSWLVSRYHPRPEELPAALDPAGGAAYSLAAVAGWLRTMDGPSQRRKRLYLVNEGSLVLLPSLPAGDLARVEPEYENRSGALPHPVYRYGLAFGFGW